MKQMSFSICIWATGLHFDGREHFFFKSVLLFQTSMLSVPDPAT